MADTLVCTIESPCCGAEVDEVTRSRPFPTEATAVVRCRSCGLELVARLVMRRLGSDDAFTLAGRPRTRHPEEIAS